MASSGDKVKRILSVSDLDKEEEVDGKKQKEEGTGNGEKHRQTNEEFRE